MSHDPQRRRLHIERLELDLRGVAPDTARAVALALGPALASAMTPAYAHGAGGRWIDAGRISAASASDVSGMASDIARRIADTTRRRP